mmetsp:Transcript_5438/g.14041  ORF Transcript_5438/g.14041 Transcript_5438/m.14041 type:complete len:351 (-) Transcript_5438:520-1572(-)
MCGDFVFVLTTNLVFIRGPTPQPQARSGEIEEVEGILAEHELLRAHECLLLHLRVRVDHQLHHLGLHLQSLEQRPAVRVVVDEPPDVVARHLQRPLVRAALKNPHQSLQNLTVFRHEVLNVHFPELVLLVEEGPVQSAGKHFIRILVKLRDLMLHPLLQLLSQPIHAGQQLLVRIRVHEALRGNVLVEAALDELGHQPSVPLPVPLLELLEDVMLAHERDPQDFLLVPLADHLGQLLGDVELRHLLRGLLAERKQPRAQTSLIQFLNFWARHEVLGEGGDAVVFEEDEARLLVPEQHGEAGDGGGLAALVGGPPELVAEPFHKGVDAVAGGGGGGRGGGGRGGRHGRQWR